MPVIFFDTNALYIEGYRDSFTAGSLTADFTERGVGVRVLHGTDYLVNDPWQNYAHPDGSQFASGDDLMAYLNAQFAMRRPLGFAFAQTAPSALWLISHPLGYRPAVTLIDTAGDPMTADPRYPDENTVTVAFSAPTAGIAYLS